MKKILLIMAMILLTSGAYAQTEETAAKKNEVKGFQWGVSARAEFVNLFNSQASANLSLGYRIDRRNYVGVQSGFIFKGKTYRDADPGNYYYRGIPLLAEYTHYFPVGRTKMHSIYAGLEGGGAIAHYYNGFGCTWDNEHKTQIYNTTPVNKTHPYIGMKTGIDFNLADVTHLQLGIIISYIGYGVSAGLTF